MEPHDTARECALLLNSELHLRRLGVRMIDWHAELVSITERIAEIEAKISLQSEKVRQLSGSGPDFAKAGSILVLLQERLKNAENHKRFIESRNPKQSTGGDLIESTKWVREPIQNQNINLAENAPSVPLKQVHIQNITIEIK